MTAETLLPSAPPTSEHASPATLAKATVGAALVATAVLTLFVLPAEYGLDPTGVGGAIGLTGMAAGAQVAPQVAPQPTSGDNSALLPDKSTITRAGAWREDEMTIELPPHSGQEIKAHMNKGDNFVFEWASSGGPVKVDMHGEHPNAADGEFTSYWEERQQDSAQGNFTAPFAGTHGWYWRNKSDTPVTVTVKTAGFYKDLFQPHG